jgi:hypothetical protein
MSINLSLEKRMRIMNYTHISFYIEKSYQQERVYATVHKNSSHGKAFHRNPKDLRQAYIFTTQIPFYSE